MSVNTVLVTGATGFIGCRLVERLALSGGYRVRAMVRRFSGAGMARLSRLPVQLVSADLRDGAAVAAAAEGCDLVVHCAYGSSGAAEDRADATIAGTEHVLKAAHQHGARKVIHLSTAAVYGRTPLGPIADEALPFATARDAYTTTKQQAETVVWNFHRSHGLPVVVFRPTLVYGPYGGAWTVQIVNDLKTGAVLVDGGSGAANLIYIDNLIDAVLLALESDRGDGQDFILVDDDTLTWGDVYRRYAAMMERPILVSMTSAEIAALRNKLAVDALRKSIVTPLLVAPEVIPELARSSFQSATIRSKLRDIPWMRALLKYIPASVKSDDPGGGPVGNGAATVRPRPLELPLPSKEKIEFYSAPTRFSNAKVKRVLGYTQRISGNEAFELTRGWLAYQGLIP